MPLKEESQAAQMGQRSLSRSQDVLGKREVDAVLSELLGLTYSPAKRYDERRLLPLLPVPPPGIRRQLSLALTFCVCLSVTPARARRSPARQLKERGSLRSALRRTISDG